MLQDASIMPATKSKKEIRTLGAMERLFWLMDQKHPAHHGLPKDAFRCGYFFSAGAGV
jgi:hypothetical protein